jgi:hypothetical protein
MRLLSIPRSGLKELQGGAGAPAWEVMTRREVMTGVRKNEMSRGIGREE